MKIPVTRGFDTTKVIGVLELRDDIEILPDAEFSIGYTIEERASDGTPTKIKVRVVSLIYPPAVSAHRV